MNVFLNALMGLIHQYKRKYVMIFIVPHLTITWIKLRNHVLWSAHSIIWSNSPYRYFTALKPVELVRNMLDHITTLLSMNVETIVLQLLHLLIKWVCAR